MTLALQGKSPRRKATLFLAAVLALIGGVMLAFAFGAFTHAQTPPDGTIQVHKYLLNTNNGKWQNQGVGNGPYVFEAATDAGFSQNDITFSNLSPSPDIPQQTFWIRETSAPSGQVAAGWYLPEQDSSGNPNCGSASTDGTGLSPSPFEVNGSEWATTSGNQTGILHLCAYNVPASTIVVKKVANPAGVTSDTSTVFSGALTYGGSFPTGTDQSWSLTGIGGSDTVANILPGSYTATETSPSNGWTLTGFAAANSQGVCPASATAYTSNIASLTVDVAPGASATVCVMNLKAAGTRTIHIVKRLQSGASDSSTFSGTISNNGGVGFTGLAVSTASTDNGQNISVSSGQSHTVVETVIPSGYSLVGYAVIAGTSTSSCFPGGGLDTTSTAVVPDDSQDYVVCIVNQASEATPSPTPTQTASPTPTQSTSPTPTQSTSPTPTQTATTPTPSASATTTPTGTPGTATPTTSGTPSPTPTRTGTASPSPSASPPPAFTPTMRPPQPPAQRPPARPVGPRPPVAGSGVAATASGTSLAMIGFGFIAVAAALTMAALALGRREED